MSFKEKEGKILYNLLVHRYDFSVLLPEYQCVQKQNCSKNGKLLTAGHEFRQIKKSKNAITSAYSHILEQA